MKAGSKREQQEWIDCINKNIAYVAENLSFEMAE
jgi:hypothetical protein